MGLPAGPAIQRSGLTATGHHRPATTPLASPPTRRLREVVPGRLPPKEKPYSPNPDLSSARPCDDRFVPAAAVLAVTPANHHLDPRRLRQPPAVVPGGLQENSPGKLWYHTTAGKLWYHTTVPHHCGSRPPSFREDSRKTLQENSGTTPLEGTPGKLSRKTLVPHPGCTTPGVPHPGGTTPAGLQAPRGRHGRASHDSWPTTVRGPGTHQ